MLKSAKTHRMKIFGVDDMLIGAAIGGLSSIFTNKSNSDNVAATNAANIGMQRETNQQNLEEAQRNRDYQERLSNSAYQRTMQDMYSAHLNPILAYQKGGASTPSGGQAALTAPKAESFSRNENVGAAAVNTAMSLRTNTQQLENLRETQGQIHADTKLKEAQRQNTMANTAIATEDLSPAQLRAGIAKIDKTVYDSKFGSTARKVGTTAEELERTTNPILNSAKKVTDTLNPFVKGSGKSYAPPGKIPTKYTEDNHYQATTFNKRFPSSRTGLPWPNQGY